VSPIPAEELRESEHARHLAAKYVWWRDPCEALQDETHFLGMLMTYGTLEDTQWMLKNFSQDELRRAIRGARPGVFNGRSWHFWHVWLGLGSPGPLPERELPA